MKKSSLFTLTLIVVILFVSLACSSTPRKRSIGEVIDDSVITNKLKVKYLRDKVVKGFRIDIDSWKGVVSLRGKVDGQEQIDRAISLAERQPGVKEVKSYLIIRTADKSSKPEKVRKEEIKDEVVEEELVPVKPTAEPQVASDAPLVDEKPLDDKVAEPKASGFEDEANLDRPPSEITGGGY